MATVIATTSLDLTPEKKQQVIDALGNALGTVFRSYSLYFVNLPEEQVAECTKGQTTIFVFVPPYMEVERRRKLVKVLNDAMVAETGDRGPLKNIVIFKYHDDEACGVDGVLRADAKAAAAQK